MATQSLYRRYRPRRFDELKGQDHVVRALRNAVINNREGQAYLFSGPRGTGKTSTARILAKVLNCEKLKDGEPCGKCNSCVSIDVGSSYDVLELDAASNNGVDNMRDLIERAALGNPGRHRVFILDEVHMLSKPAEAALLKTLEEPPEHVVFVLATTDPQKVSETIRSRTQHLQFHLLPMQELKDHVNWVVADAKLVISPAAIDRVVQLGGGSVRDTLSALELAVASGGELEEQISLDEFIEAFIDHDPGRALAAVGASVQFGADPRALTEDIVRNLRDLFLSLMAPELVQLPEQRAEIVNDQARRMGASSVVRAIEVLGEVLIEIRHAPDARLLLEVSLVKLTRQNSSTDISALMARIEKLESGVIANRDPTGPITRPVIVDPDTGRAKIGSRATPLVTTPSASVSSAAVASAVSSVVVSGDNSASKNVKSESTENVAPNTATVLSDDEIKRRWPDVVASQKPMVRALFSAVNLVDYKQGLITLSAPSEVHITKSSEHLQALMSSLKTIAGKQVQISFVVGEAKRNRNSRQSSPELSNQEIEEPIDLAETTKVPTGTQSRPIDDLAKLFPGSQIIDDKK
ncbi:MAG: DNA polymerase III subunit gamma/tau [Actinobacteria bacterium]|nr:MAG: DNA polymerase III subunit gamma/tau [Actinomycetota bacterium]